MKRKFTTGQFAEIANVTPRTIRYYDTIGLLRPNKIAENGYRYYTEEDLFKIQRILLLKQLGFTLDEIMPILLENDLNSFLQSLNMQTELIDKKIEHLNYLKSTLKNTTQLIEKNGINWKQVLDLIRVVNNDHLIVEQYYNSTNLNIRIELHERFSKSGINWFRWLFNQIDFNQINRLLELGCGNGKLWEQLNLDLRNREIYLSDISKGMIEDTKKRLNNSDFSYLVIDAVQIPFKDNFFDAIIANHVLFYLKDLHTGLQEINRVINETGCFYCTTYSGNHMWQLVELVQQFDSKIKLSHHPLYENFGLKNGKQILEKYFNHVELKIFNDELIIDEPISLINYILSCHGNQNETIGKRLEEFKKFIEERVTKDHPFTITKEAGLFICQNKR